MDENCVKFLLTNARSITPKLASLGDAFASLQLHFACVTETWLGGGPRVKDKLVDFEGSSGIRIVGRNRARGGRVGGGVAVAFNTSTCNLKRRSLKSARKDQEVLCMAGRVGKIKRKVVIFVIYVPPASTVAQHEALCVMLDQEISAATVDYGDPVIFVGGDFNHRDVMSHIDCSDDFNVIPTGPTRGPNILDRFYSNVGELVKEAKTLPPLQAGNGNESDHKCVFAAVEFPDEKGYKWEVKFSRKRSQIAEDGFARDLGEHDWSRLKDLNDVDDMTTELENVVRSLTDKWFPISRTRKRSTEQPWINRTIRRLFKKKVRIYKKQGRSQRWWDTDALLQAEIKERRNQFVDDLLAEGNGGSSFYAATKKLASAHQKPAWNVTDLFQGRSDAEVCQEVLDYFGEIAQSGDDSLKNIGLPRVDGGLGHFSVERTADLLKNAKTATSRVEGDPLVNLSKRCPIEFAVPVSQIYNKINTSGRWPKSWKTEHLTIIPKMPNPSGLSECRNISCTSVFSKIL